MSKYEITVKDNETNKETIYNGDMFILGVGTMDNKGIIQGRHGLSGDYFLLSRLYVGQGANLQKIFSERFKEE